MVRPSGPAARELPPCRMAWVTRWGVNGEAVVTRGRSEMMRRLTRRVFESDEWGMMLVNCLQKAVAISLFLVRMRELKVMGWLGGGMTLLVDRDLMMRWSCDVLYLCEHDSSVLIHI